MMLVDSMRGKKKAGYHRTGKFNRVFRRRREYSGYKLEVFRKEPGGPVPK